MRSWKLSQRFLCGLALLSAILFTATSVPGAQVLFVADIEDPADEPSNESVIEHLTDLGHTVEPLDDNEVLDFDTTGFELIVISSTTLSTNVGFEFTELPIPIINWENALSDELLFSDGGQTADSDVIDVLDTSHPMAGLMGLTQTGEVLVRDFPATFHMVEPSNLAPDALIIAEDPGSGGAAIVVVDTDGELVDGSTATGTRISLFYGDQALLDGTDEGLSILNGAIDYALGNFGGGPPELIAGDSDRDLDFDQIDLVQVQIAAKYLTGNAATWGEGDWNGAPGGDQDNPPAGDGRFDQLDIIAAAGYRSLSDRAVRGHCRRRDSRG